MTWEEAIRILDPETTGEALAEIEYYAGFSGKTAAVHAVSDACEVAVSIMRQHEHLEAEYKGLQWRHAKLKNHLEGTDFVNVTRCKVCQYSEQHEGGAAGRPGLYKCTSTGICHEPDYFCASGFPRRCPDEN